MAGLLSETGLQHGCEPHWPPCRIGVLSPSGALSESALPQRRFDGSACRAAGRLTLHKRCPVAARPDPPFQFSKNTRGVQRFASYLRFPAVGSRRVHLVRLVQQKLKKSEPDWRSITANSGIPRPHAAMGQQMGGEISRKRRARRFACAGGRGFPAGWRIGGGRNRPSVRRRAISNIRHGHR